MPIVTSGAEAGSTVPVLVSSAIGTSSAIVLTFEPLTSSWTNRALAASCCAESTAGTPVEPGAGITRKFSESNAAP